MAIAEYFKRLLNNKYQVVDTSVFDLLPWLLIPGLIGARIYHVVDYWSYYAQDLKQIFFVWRGGLGIWGGIMGGAIGLWTFVKLQCQMSNVKTKSDLVKTTTKNLKLVPTFLLYLDLIAIGLPLGQAVGRLGNYFNQELYGLPTNLPWGIYIRPENRLPGWENFAKFHPLFLYESLWCILIFLILLFYLRAIVDSRYHSGSLFFFYLFLYSFGRFWLEFLRIDSWVIDGLRMNQLVAVGGMLVATLFFIKYRLQFPRKFSNIHFGQ